MKCDCAARWSLTAIKEFPTTPRPKGCCGERVGMTSDCPAFSRSIVVYPQDRAISPDPEAVLLMWDYPMDAASCYAHLPLTPSVGSPFGSAYTYTKTADASRASG